LRHGGRRQASLSDKRAPTFRKRPTGASAHAPVRSRAPQPGQGWCLPERGKRSRSAGNLERGRGRRRAFRHLPIQAAPKTPAESPRRFLRMGVRTSLWKA